MAGAAAGMKSTTNTLWLSLIVAVVVLITTTPTTTAFTSSSTPGNGVLPIITTSLSSQHSTRLYVSADESSSSSAATTTIPENSQEEKEFLFKTAILCRDRNIPFEKIKNARDLSSVRNSPIKPGRVYRVGRVSDATTSDLHILFDEIGMKTLVDLRSPTELKDDATLDREEVFGNFTDMVFYESRKLVKELGPDESRMQKRRKRDRVREAVNGAVGGTKDVLLGFVDNFFGTSEEEAVLDDDSAEEEEEEECNDCIEAAKLLEDTKRRRNRKERHFVSIMNELKYVRGTLSKLRKRDIAKTILKSPTTIISKTARENIKKPFLDEINGGGLPMLNELVLRFGAQGIKYVLDLVSDVNRHPIAFYCTAGKDRTGMIAAIILALLGADDESIVEDYSLSANVYAEMNDHKAMVGALSQRNLDAKTFLGAPPQVMKDTLTNIRRDYGSVEKYLDYIGFDEESRQRLIRALTQ